MKAVIPAAGLGSRFLPTTKTVPKELFPVLDKPVIQHVVEEALDAPGCDECCIITSAAKPGLQEHFSPSPALVDELRSRGKDRLADAVQAAGDLPVSFVMQDEALGLGHAVHCSASRTQDEPFYVLLGDVIVPDHAILPLLAEVSREHEGASVIAVIPVAEHEVSRFGVIAGEFLGGATEPEAAGAVWKISGLVEKPPAEEAPSRLAIFGRYLLSSRVQELLATTAPGAGNEIQLTDALVQLLDEEAIYAVVIDDSMGYDTGTIENLINANVRLALHDDRYADALREKGIMVCQ